MSQLAASSRLRPVLKLRDLVLYGIVIITPIAPVPIYGVMQQLSRGHVILCLMLAGTALMLTAFSYGRMATLYPSAGSAYVYVGRGLNPSLGFIAGWSMTLDYVALPIVAMIQASIYIQRLLPSVPYAAWIALFIVLITALNLLGIRATARANIALMVVMTVVIVAFLVLSVRYLLDQHGAGGLFSLKPFYDPASFDARSIAAATSFAALTFVGFDGVTALAEDAQNPKRNIPLATVSVCLFTTLFSCVLVYLAQLIYPDYRVFDNVETAFMDVTRRVGGRALFHGLGIIVILSSLGAALAAEVAVARVLLAMGRDNVLPSRFFARVNSRTDNPTLNILLISLLVWIGSLFLSLERAGELLNFGALLAFMGVNLAAFRQGYLLQERKQRRLFADAMVPLSGFLFCLLIWLTMPVPAKLLGGAWLLAGIAYYWMGRSLKRRGERVLS